MNLSARQFAREGLADHVEALLRQSGVSSRQLGLEMTESSLITDANTAMEVLGSLRRLGVSLLMDDFGTGYSSLHHLHAYPFDVLKIDRSFVMRMTEGDQPMQIVRTIIELARALGMSVVAEGIETVRSTRYYTWVAGLGRVSFRTADARREGDRSACACRGGCCLSWRVRTLKRVILALVRWRKLFWE